MRPHEECSEQNATSDAASWAGVASIAAGAFLLVTTEFLPIGMLSPIAAGFRVTEGTAGLAVTAPGFIAAIAAPVMTIAAGRVDRRTVIVVMTLAIIVSNVIAAAAPDFTIFLIGRLILGVAVGGLWSFAVAIGRRLVPESAGARATSIISAGISAGTVCGMPVGAVAGDLVGWRWVFAANALLGLLIILAQVRFLPRLPTIVPINVARLIDFARVPMARIGLIASGFVAAGHFIAYTFLEPHLRDSLAFGQSGVALALAGYAVAGIAGAFAGEHLAIRNIRQALAVSSAAVGLFVVAAASLRERRQPPSSW
ncbi:MFS transporter [Pseudoroseomonas wenyumeiae]